MPASGFVHGLSGDLFDLPDAGLKGFFDVTQGLIRLTLSC
jgi:hypothetical protein